MKKSLWIVLFISFVNALSISIVVPIIYLYAKKYGLSDFAASLLLTSYSISQFVATPIIGRLSDYYGRKPLLTISLFGTVVANILSAFAPSAVFLFSARILDGITGGNNSVAQAVISDTTSPAERTKSFGLFGAAYGTAFIVGPLVSILLQEISLSTVYLFSSFIALLAALLTIFVLPETIEQREDQKLNLGNLGFLSIFKSLRTPLLGKFLFLYFMTTLIFGVFQFGFQPFAVNNLEAFSQQISLVLLVFGFTNVFMRTMGLDYLLERLDEVKILMFGLIGSGLLLLLISQSLSFTMLVLLVPFFAASTSVFRPIISSYVSRSSKKEDQGIAMGLGESYFSLAGSVGPILGGMVVGLSYRAPLILSALISGLGLIYLYRHKDHLAPQIKTDL